MNTNLEGRRAAVLAEELTALTLLENYKRSDQAEVTLSLTDKSVTNHAEAVEMLQRRIEALINNELVPIIETIVANQRDRVSTARKALLDLMFTGSADDNVKPETAQQVNGALDQLGDTNLLGIPDGAPGTYQTDEQLSELEGTDPRDEAAADRALETEAAD